MAPSLDSSHSNVLACLEDSGSSRSVATVKSGNLRSSDQTVGLSYDSVSEVSSCSSDVHGGRSVDSFRSKGTVSALNKMNDIDLVLDKYRSEMRSKRKSLVSPSSGIHERLYEDGRVKDLQKMLAAERKKREEEDVPPPQLQIATRSYTPIRQAHSSVPTHERLYKMNEHAHMKLLEQRRAKMENLFPKSRPDSRGRDASTRLYKESKTMQEEGKLMRKKIEDKLRARAPTPTRSITLEKANRIYERGQTAAREKELKIEMLRNAPRKSSFPKMRTQTPTRNRERYYESREGDGTSTRSSSCAPSCSRTPSRARYSSPSTNRARNQTFSRSRPGDDLEKSIQRSQSRNQTRSRTSSRQRERSQTPSRRMSQSRASSSSASKIKVGSPQPKLPPSFKISQTE